MTVKGKDSWQFERGSDGRSRGWSKRKEETKRGYGRKTKRGKQKWMGKRTKYACKEDTDEEMVRHSVEKRRDMDKGKEKIYLEN